MCKFLAGGLALSVIIYFIYWLYAETKDNIIGGDRIKQIPDNSNKDNNTDNRGN